MQDTIRTKADKVYKLLHEGNENQPLDAEAKADTEWWINEALTHEELDYDEDKPIQGNVRDFIRTYIRRENCIKALYSDDYIDRMAEAVSIIDGETPMESTVEAMFECAWSRGIIEKKEAKAYKLLHDGDGNEPVSDLMKANSEAWITEAIVHDYDDYSKDRPIQGDVREYISSIVREDARALYPDDYIARMADAVSVIDGDAPMESTVGAMFECAACRKVVWDYCA